MNFIQVLTRYLLHQFPWWQGSQLRYEPAQKTVYVYCQHLFEPEFLLPEVETIAGLDIGVERFILTVPREMDVVIECQPDQNREKL